MKRFLILFACACVTAMLSAQPKLAGHRGSLFGLENSVESFTNGALRGYDYLETDVKVTADGQYVCCHNDDLTTWGGTLTIASSTLAQLQAEALSQTRGGVHYAGRLCSLGEYLDICRQYHCHPLIELKWATHINSNDCSGIPALITFIDQHISLDSIAILTSMKPCLTYIKQHYPDIELYFLRTTSTGLTDADYQYCVQYGINVDPAAGSFTKDDVERFHAAGLKVAMWTANTAAAYKTYGEMGCDMITTDSLDPATLPTLQLPIENALQDLAPAGEEVVKCITEGQVLILCDNRKYTLAGQQLP